MQVVTKEEKCYLEEAGHCSWKEMLLSSCSHVSVFISTGPNVSAADISNEKNKEYIFVLKFRCIERLNVYHNVMYCTLVFLCV